VTRPLRERPSPRLLRSRRGAALVEAAFALPILLILIVGIVEFGRFIHTKVTLDNAVREGARFASTGQRLADPDDPEARMARGEGIRQQVLAYGSRLGLAPGSVQIDPADGGGPGQWVTVEVEHLFQFSIPLLTALLNDPVIVLHARSKILNEPFPQETGGEQET
jgi:hypothetical protein